MKFKIHFRIKEVKDYIIIEGETVSEISEQANKQLQQRGLDIKENKVWSERV